MESLDLTKLFAVIAGNAGGLFALWKLFQKFRADIEAPLLAEISQLRTLLNDCYKERTERADELVDRAWDGNDRRREDKE